MYGCPGLFLLALSYHFGAQSAEAQAPSNPVVGVSSPAYANVQVVMTSNGDCFTSGDYGQTWLHTGNCFGGGPINVERHTIGQLKTRFRDPAPTGR